MFNDTEKFALGIAAVGALQAAAPTMTGCGCMTLTRVGNLAAGLEETLHEMVPEH